MFNKKTENKHISFSEGILIGIFTIGAYLIAFSYEAGFLNYFGIPADFFSVDLENFFFTLIGLSSFIVFLFFILDLSLFFKPATREGIGMRIYNYIIILIFILFPILYINDFKFNWEIGLFILIYLIIYLGTPLLYRKEKSYLDKFKQHEKTENSVESLLDKLGNLIGGKKLIGFILFVYLLGVSFLLGNFNAVEKEDFVVANINGDNFVIVKIHKESVILLEIDAEKKTFNNRFYIKERTQLANFLLERKKIGSLISIDKENGKK